MGQKESERREVGRKIERMRERESWREREKILRKSISLFGIILKMMMELMWKLMEKSDNFCPLVLLQLFNCCSIPHHHNLCRKINSTPSA